MKIFMNKILTQKWIPVDSICDHLSSIVDKVDNLRSVSHVYISPRGFLGESEIIIEF